MTNLIDIIAKLRKNGKDKLADEIENSMEYTTFHRNDNVNEIRQSKEFKMAIRNLLERKQANIQIGNTWMSYNYRALADDKYEDNWLGMKIYNELAVWAKEQGMDLHFYEHANIRGDYQLCFKLKW